MKNPSKSNSFFEVIHEFELNKDINVLLSPEETYKIQNLIQILKFKSEFNKTMTIWSFIQQLIKIKNYFLSKNHSKITLFDEDSYIQMNENKEFQSFINKSLFCFNDLLLNELYYEKNDNFFQNYLPEIDPYIGISEFFHLICLEKLNDPLFKNCISINKFLKISKFQSNNTSNNNQIINDLYKNYSNKLILTKNFENLRFLFGDCLLKFLLKKLTIFIFDKESENFIQITGRNFKDELLELLDARVMNNLISPISSNAILNNFNKPIDMKKDFIPNLPYFVERNKIFYCPNFNRKMGIFKGCFKSKEISKDKDIGNIYLHKYGNRAKEVLYISKRFFYEYENLYPDKVKEEIIKYSYEISNNMKKYEYVRKLTLFCPNYFYEKTEMKENKDNKNNKVENGDGFKYNQNKGLNTKNDESIFPYKNIKDQIKTLYINCKNKQTDISNLQFIYDKLLNSTIEYSNIYNLLKDYIKSIIPRSFIGDKNLNIIINKLWSFIILNRFETFNKISLFEKKEFDFNDIKWLSKCFSMKKTDKSMKKLILLKNFIMKNLIFTIYDFFIVQFLRSHFYITERQGFNYKIFYYHKCNWNYIMKITELKFSNQYTSIAKIAAIEKLKEKDLAPGKMRVVPKNNTYRPIVSYKKKTFFNKKLLKNEFFQTNKIFKYISQKLQSDQENCVVFDYKQIIQKLIYFKEGFKKENEYKLSKEEDYIDTNILNFTNMDIEKCYDNISIKKLTEIIDNTDLISEEYLTTSIFVLLPKANILSNKENKINTLKECFEVKKIFTVVDIGEYIHYLDLLRSKNDLNYTYCMVYFCNDHIIRKDNFINKIKDIINNNYIRFNKKYFLQTKGIPQGLSISSFLCNLYFYSLEKEIVKLYNIPHEKSHKKLTFDGNASTINVVKLKKENSLLMRFMDDYLLMTTNKLYTMDIILKLNTILIEYDSNFNMIKSKNNIPDLVIEVISNKAFNIGFKPIEKEVISKGAIFKSNLISENKILVPKSLQENINLYKSKITTNANWNGICINFNTKNRFNLIMESKEEYDINKYATLINVNIPIDFTSNLEWLYKKASSIFLTGHPWIFFIQKLTNYHCLESNFNCLVKNIFFKLIVLFKSIIQNGVNLQQKRVIKVIDDCIKKLFLYFSHKLSRFGEKMFYIDDYYQFIQSFYERLFKLYIYNNTWNYKLIALCPFIFKVIRRKVYRLKKQIQKKEKVVSLNHSQKVKKEEKQEEKNHKKIENKKNNKENKLKDKNEIKVEYKNNITTRSKSKK